MNCALHPDHAAVDTCAHCGHFMCAGCSAGSTRVRCPTCRAAGEAEAASGGPLKRLLAEPVGLGALCSAAWAGFTREPVMLGAGAFVALLLGGLAGVPAQLVDGWYEAVGQERLGYLVAYAMAWMVCALLQQAVLGPLQMGELHLSRAALAAQPVDGLAPLFGQWRKGPRIALCFALMLVAILTVTFIGAVAVGVWAAVASLSLSSMLVAGVLVLAITPLALWFLLPLVLTNAVFAFEDDAGPFSALQRCYALARHRRLLLLGVTAVSVAALFAGLLLFCLGLFPAFAFMQVLWTATYLRLREAEPRPAQAEPLSPAPAGATG